MSVDNINNKLKSVSSTTGYYNTFNKNVRDTVNINALDVPPDLKSGDTKDGIKSVSNKNLGNKSFAFITEDIPEISDQLIKQVDNETEIGSETDVGSPKTTYNEAINSIIGSSGSTDKSFLDLTVTSPTPDGMKNTLNTIATIDDTQLNTVMNNIVPPEYVDLMPDALKTSYTDTTRNLKNTILSYNENFKSRIGLNSDNPIVSLLLGQDVSLKNELGKLGLPVNELDSILSFLESGNKDEVIKQIILSKLNLQFIPPHQLFLINQFLNSKQFRDAEKILNILGIDFNLNEIKQTVNDLSKFEIRPSNKLSNNIQRNTEIFDTQVSQNKWKGATTTPEIFLDVTSEEELYIEFRNCKREITRLVFFGYTINNGQSLTAEDLHKIETTNNLNGINMHYIVRTDGTLQRGRPLEINAEFDEGHQLYTIAVGLIYSSKINTIQTETVNSIMKAFYNTWPGGMIISADDIDQEYTKPGFPVDKYNKIYGREFYGDYTKASSTAELITLAKEN